jgi:tetratricopeptide (TPR) repeat protein
VSTPAELHQRGVAANNAGRYAEARRLLTRALALSEDEETTALVESSLAHLEAETGDWPAALSRCEGILGRSGLSDRTRGSVRGQRAMLLMLSGRLQEALSDFSSAIVILNEDPDFLGRALLNRGGVYLQLQEVTAAEVDFRAAAAELGRADLPVESAMAQHNLGYCRFLAGDLVSALQLIDEAAVVLSPLSAVSEATVEQDRAEVLMAAGLVEDGRAALKAAARAYGSRRLRRRQAEAELALARASVFGSPAQAMAEARNAARHFRTASAPAMAARAEAIGLGAAVQLGKHGPRLLERATELERELAAEGARWEATSVALMAIRALVMRGDLTTAGHRLARTRVGRQAPLGVRLLDRETRAEFAAARQLRPKALGHLRAGLTDLHAWQSSFGSLDLQTMVAGHGTRLGVMGLALAVDSPRSEALFEWSERARMLASRIQSVRAPQDEQTSADLAELRTGAAPDREAELRRRIRERAWQHKGSGEVADPATLAELQAGLGADTALAAYVVTADKVVALVVTDGASVRHDLGDRSRLDDLLGGLLPDLDMAASDLPGPLACSVRQGLADRLARIGDLLVAPLLDDLDDRRVVLTPSGVLAGVPWPLLPGLTGRPVTVARSATSWLARQTTTSTATAGFVAGPRVARADAEVAAAASRWKNAPVLTGDAATASAVTELAGRVDVLHIAAHGRHSAENPLFSGLELADGSWFGYDIDQLPSVPQVVLLSACEMGRSSVRHGEELIGMTTAWLHAGVRWVIASAAAANDEVAHDTLLAVHAGLRAGLDPAAALAAVEHQERAAPAPFVCFS